MDLKESGEGYMGGFGGRKMEGRNIVIKLQSQRLKESQVYRESFRTARETQKNAVLKQTKEKSIWIH
jgi:predicted ribosome quality control (RQC) complex YloA/Tae2 family protein